jgi:hypothetical protein
MRPSESTLSKCNISCKDIQSEKHFLSLPFRWIIITTSSSKFKYLSPAWTQMLASSLFRILCVPNNGKIKIYKYNFFPSPPFYRYMGLGFSLQRKAIDWGCLRTEYWEKCLNLKWEVTCYRKELYYEELHTWPNIVRKIKSERMRTAGHVDSMEEMRYA